MQDDSVFSGIAPASGLEFSERDLTGLEILQDIQSGRRPYPPFSDHLTMRFAHLGKGTSTISASPNGCCLNIVGSLHGGYIVALLDTAMESACQTLLRPKQSYVTTELKTSFLRAAGLGGASAAVGKIIKAGSRVMFAEGELRTSAGVLVAASNCTCPVLTEE